MGKKKINKLAKQVKGKNLSSNIFSATSILCDIFPTVIIVNLVGNLSSNTATTNIILLSGLGIALSLTLKSLFYALSIWKAHDTAYGTLSDIRIKIVNHLKNMNIGFFQKRQTGELTNIIDHDVEQIELYLGHSLPQIMATTLLPAITFIVIIIIDWRLGIALVTTLPFTVVFNMLLQRIWANPMKHFAESTKKMSADLMEYISTISVVKAFSKEEQKTTSLLKGMNDYIKWVKKALFSISIPMSIIAMFLEGGVVIMVILGSLMLTNNQINMEQFILAIILANVFSAAFAKIATLQHFGMVFNQSMNTIGSILDTPVPVRGNNAIPRGSLDIKFNDVNFSYTNKKQTLKNINLHILQNSINAIVGTSGCGKSTLVNLLMGFWESNSGTITIGNINIQNLSEKSLSSLVSIVQQEVFLFNLTIEENIRIGKTDASDEEVVQAAKQAQIHDFIMELPNGYKTPIGESGINFSGGEKQRIAIARTILKNAPIVILDEATSAIDSNNEYLIQQAISNLSKCKTIITISHHLKTITNSDQIIVMDSGRIVSTGTHKELIDNCQLYIQMIEQQNEVDMWKIKEVQ